MQGDHQGILIEKKQVTPDCYLFTIESSKLALATPGQFIHILPQASWGISQDPLLRRPISLYDVSKEAQRGQILFRVVGRGTKALSQFVPGDLIDFLGPIGRGFTLPVGGPREVALVGGGIGLAPLFYLARRLIEEGHRVCAYFGFRGKDDYIPVEPFGQLGCAVEVFTEDGSRGTRVFPPWGWSRLYGKVSIGFTPADLFPCWPPWWNWRGMCPVRYPWKSGWAAGLGLAWAVSVK